MSETLLNKSIAVLMGGPGAERAVSLNSAAAVARALRSVGANVTEVDIADAAFTIPEGMDLAFNIIHGTFGEDGQLQAILDARGISYTGEGEVGSRLAFDKIASKKRFEAAGVPTAKWEIVEKGSAPSIPLPFVVKPPREGSSVGVHIVQDTIALDAALEDCFARDHEVLVEEFIQGKELTVGIVGDEAFPIVEIVPKVDFYTYENKYTKGASEYFCPARLDAETTRKVQEAALAAHRSLGLEVYSRVDVLLDAAGNPYVLEVNTIPGMTETSLLPKGAAAVGIDFPELCERIAELSLRKGGA
ncbi:MAG TPA: D-alanine--D-alanine ligase [Chthoniobacterales bacterium]|nr:D-alanine--D-alanine ligase [Chthoniobacterales bacterium]